MDFFKKTWVEVVAIVGFVVSTILLALSGFVVSTILLALSGFAKTDIAPIFEEVWVIFDIVAGLILAIKKLLQKKDTANK